MIALQMRSDEVPLYRMGLFRNRPILIAIGLAITFQISMLYVPFLSKLFNTQPLSLSDWIIADSRHRRFSSGNDPERMVSAIIQ